MQNGFVESFNGRMRDELLNETMFRNMAHARAVICAFHGRWASIPRDRGHSFHGIVGSHSTRRWAAGLTDGFMESGLG